MCADGPGKCHREACSSWRRGRRSAARCLSWRSSAHLFAVLAAAADASSCRAVPCASSRLPAAVRGPPSRPPVWGAHVRQVPTSGPGRARSRSLRGRPSRHPCQRRGTPGSRPAVAVRVRPVLHAWEDVSDSKIDYNDAHIPPSRTRRSRLVAVDIAAVAAFAGCGHTRSQAR